MQSINLVLFSKSDRAISEQWLAGVTPPGTKVREIPLPGFMLNVKDNRSSLSVQVFDARRRKVVIDWLRKLSPRPPKELLAELEARGMDMQGNAFTP
jgi:hypothetical protein